MGKTELPLGLISVFLVLLTTAIVNIFTSRWPQRVELSLLLASLSFFRCRNETTNTPDLRRRQMKEHFQLEHQDNVGREALEIRPGAVVVTMRDSAAPFALKWALTHTNTDDQDVVVLAARMMGAGGPEYLELPSSYSASTNRCYLPRQFRSPKALENIFLYW